MTLSGRWAASYAGALAVSGLASFAPLAGDIVFAVGAIVILVSVGYIGMGGERRMKLIRDMRGIPIAAVPLDREKRAAQLSTGVKVFLLGLALWVPLLVRAFW